MSVNNEISRLQTVPRTILRLVNGITLSPERTLDIVLESLRELVDYELAVVMGYSGDDSLMVRTMKGPLATSRLSGYTISLSARADIADLIAGGKPRLFGDDEAHVARCRDSMLEEYRRNYVNKTRPYDGIMGMLGELARQGLKLAVFSNKNDDLTKKLVAALLPEGYFAAVIGSGPGMPEKPDPSGVLLISGQLGIHPERLIYVGDSDVDMETANKAGMCGVGALWGFRTKEELISSGARYVLDHPMDLFRILHEGNGA